MTERIRKEIWGGIRPIGGDISSFEKDLGYIETENGFIDGGSMI